MKKIIVLCRHEIVFFVFFYIILILLKANELGLALRERISIPSTLDLSWQLDSIERLLHGYIQGRDFVFTYGPLFQFLYAMPSLVFHVPSYISVLLSPFISITLSFLMTIVIVKILSPQRLTQFILLGLLWFLIGIISFDPLNTVRVLIPLFYCVLWIRFLPSLKILSIPLLLISILPTIFGFFSYDLFLSTLFISLVFSLVTYFSDKKLNGFLPLFFIALFQLIGSILLTHNLSYITYSLDTVRNYYYVMNIGWAKDRSNVLFIFPLILLLLVFNLWKTRGISKKEKILLFALAFVSLFEIRTAFARSDAGHIIKSLYPSIITTYIFIFFLSKSHRNLLILGLFLYLLIPFKPTYYNTLSPKNIINLISVIKSPPYFFNIYKLPRPFYYSEKDVENLQTIIKNNPTNIYIYPYDNYILNIFHTTYNSFSLQPYQYSGSIVEKETVTRLKNHPPRFIILAIDKHGAIDLDDIPNFTRNPLIALWMIQNYEVKETTPAFLILSYNPQKKTQPATNSCTTYRLITKLPQSGILASFIKANIYYLSENPLIRLPVTNMSQEYIIFDSKNLSNLFKETLTSNNPKLKDESSLTIFQENQLTKHKTPIRLKKNEFKIQCLN